MTDRSTDAPRRATAGRNDLARRLATAERERRRARLAEAMMRRVNRLVLELHRLATRRGDHETLLTDLLEVTCTTLLGDQAVLMVRAGLGGPLCPVAAHGTDCPQPLVINAALAPVPFATTAQSGADGALAHHLATLLGVRDVAYAYDADSGFLLALGRGSVTEAIPADDRTLAEALTAVMDIYRDVCARARAESDLMAARVAAEQANRTKSDFLALMGHELRTPLNAVIGFSELIAGQTFGPLGDPRYVEYADDILSSGTELLGMINTVLDYARRNERAETLREEVVEVSRVITAARDLVRARAEMAGVTLAWEVPAALPPIRADSRLMSQVLVHLLSNAIKFTPRHGAVTVSARLTAEGGVAITVADTGIGMAEDDIGPALEPFGQIGPLMTRRHTGTGLGLPLARKMVEDHQGSLTIDSTPGRGTRVTATLPPSRVVEPPTALTDTAARYSA